MGTTGICLWYTMEGHTRETKHRSGFVKQINKELFFIIGKGTLLTEGPHSRDSGFPGRRCEAEGSEGPRGKLTKGHTQHWLLQALPAASGHPSVPSGHGSAPSCHVAPSGHSTLPMPCPVPVKMSWKEGPPTTQGLVSAIWGFVLLTLGVIYTSPRQSLGAEMLGEPGSLWDSTSAAPSRQRPRVPRKRGSPQRGPVGQTSPGGSKDSLCRILPLVPPAGAHQWAWVAVVMGGGLNWEGTGKIPNARRARLTCSFTKPDPSAWLAGHHKPGKLSHDLEGLICVLLRLTVRELTGSTGGQAWVLIQLCDPGETAGLPELQYPHQ